jgi:hypothetical protein
MLLFFTDVHPLNQSLLNRMEIFNEWTLLVCSYFLFAFTDFVGDVETRYLFGWVFIGLAVCNICVNWCALFYKFFMVGRLFIRRYLHQRWLRQRQAQRELTLQQQ